MTTSIGADIEPRADAGRGNVARLNPLCDGVGGSVIEPAPGLSARPGGIVATLEGEIRPPPPRLAGLAVAFLAHAGVAFLVVIGSPPPPWAPEATDVAVIVEADAGGDQPSNPTTSTGQTEPKASNQSSDAIPQLEQAPAEAEARPTLPPGATSDSPSLAPTPVASETPQPLPQPASTPV